jgi:hypothetical protein
MKEKLLAAWKWLYVGKPLPPLVDQNGEQLPPPSAEQARLLFREALTNRVADGWKIEIENQFDAVLSRKQKPTWIGKLILFLILLIVFAPLALFYLIIVIITSVNAKPSTLRIWIDEDGRIQQQ